MKNNRTFLEKLLDGAEVEWKPLSKIVTTITAPVKLKREMYCSTGSTPIIDQGEKFIAGYTDENFETIPSNEYIIFGDHSEHIKYINFSFIQGADGLKILKPKKDNAKYIYYAFQNFYVKELNYKRHWSSAKETLIPIPPPTVQTEIVKILDALTALTSELTSELILRRKQYEYYREKLLSEEELEKVGFEWKPLGEVTNIKTGQAVSKYSISQNPGIYPVINSGREPLGFINEWNTENDPIGITTRGAGVGSITWQEGKYFRGNLNYSVTVKSDYKLNIRFLYHILLHFQKEIHNLCSFTGIPALNASELKKLEIPIPPLPVQTEIVKILDALTALTRELTSELILRRKQYEYYRERLLSFDSLEQLNMGGGEEETY